MHNSKLIGPFAQALTMDNLPLKGPISDDRLAIIPHAGLLVNAGRIEAIGPFAELETLASIVEPVEGEQVVLPGFVDCHTHICWAGTRAGDYAMRLAGKSYLQIAQQGGGIWSTVTHTRAARLDELSELTAKRANRLLQMGTTTIEVKSGYGLNPAAELKMLKAIHKGMDLTRADLSPTCLAAHIKPRDYEGSADSYLAYLIKELLPEIRATSLCNRVDIYVDEGAFDVHQARYYLAAAKELGFSLVVHADQFKRGGAGLAVEMGALSADHLENSSDEDIRLLAQSDVIPVALPGASMGLGMRFAPARKLLDAGASLAVASDWNPGSAPMGNLLTQAAVLGTFERMTMAETLSAITFRAAATLGLHDRGIVAPGRCADMVSFPCADYREILYHQGSLLPSHIWKNGMETVPR